MKINAEKDFCENLIKNLDGMLRLKPAWVARDFLPPGRRFGLSTDQYELGNRGGICERWLASTTKADNAVSVPHEGLSFVDAGEGKELLLKDLVETCPKKVMGKEYAAAHESLGRLAKIFDYADRLPYHIHQMDQHARLVGCNSKEEAYYFPEGVDPGPSPETFFGVHPYIAREKKYDVLIPHLKAWKDDSILQHARAYKQIPGDGWHVPAGTLHAPGSAMTIELQEDSDVFAMLQAKVGGEIISKDLLYKDVTDEERDRKGELSVLDMINWEISGDPYFYENRHTPPVVIEETRTEAAQESWIFYNTDLFSGKRLVVSPGGSFSGNERGVFNILIWRGKGLVGGLEVEGQNDQLDELFVCHDRAQKNLIVENTGTEDLVLFKFFGPGINPDTPKLKKYKG